MVDRLIPMNVVVGRGLGEYHFIRFLINEYETVYPALVSTPTLEWLSLSVSLTVDIAALTILPKEVLLA